MPLTVEQIRAQTKSYAPVHGRNSHGSWSKTGVWHGKKQATRAPRPLRGARAGFTDTRGGKGDVWSHRDLAR